MIKRYIILIVGLIITILVSGHPQLKENIDKEIDSNPTDEIKFILVGDPQINISTGNGIERLRQVIEYINKSNVDFVVFLGDMTEDGKEKSNDLVNNIIKSLKKPYYVVAGNHDIKHPKIFENHYGQMEHIESVKGYQLIFVGIDSIKNYNGNEELNWSFDFNKANKNVPTLVFIHGPVIDAKGCFHCLFQKDDIYYANSIKSELEKFTNLIGVYSGHAHFDSNYFNNKTRYVTVNGLVNLKMMNLTLIRASNKIGYSTVKGNKSNYELINYR